MNRNKDPIILKGKQKLILIPFAIILLIIITATFSLVIVDGKVNLIMFFILISIYFLIVLLFLARHIYIGIVMMFAGGLFGYFCDLWGVGNNLWLYNKNTDSFYIMNGRDLTNGGFPIEIVASYFFAALFLMNLMEFLFEAETEELIQEYDSGIKLIKSNKQMIPALIVITISTVIIIIEPLYWESMGYFSIGVFMISLVPGNKKLIPILFGIGMGFTGLFLELFCSGKIIPGVEIWTYQQTEWDAFVIPSPRILGAPISALYAYFGVGATLASIYLLLLKIPIFRKETPIFPIFPRLSLEKKKKIKNNKTNYI
ncbi:MAG: hypothetical protein ACTSR8_14340 [Promethearchaeota archaeon]